MLYKYFRPVASICAALALVLSIVAAPVAVADAAGKAGDFVPIAPYARALDTRNAIGGPTGHISPGGSRSVQITGVGGVPGTGVRAVMVAVTPVGPTASTYLTLWPTGSTRPVTSNINVPANSAPISNNAIVQIGTNGKIDVYNNSGNTHVVIDINGYFTDTPGGSNRGGFVPTAHTLLFDTRSGMGGVPKATIPAKGTLTVTVPDALVPAGANAVFLDLIVPAASTNAWLAAYPTGGSTSYGVMSYATGTTASGVSVKIDSDNKIHFYNNGSAAINLLAYLQGYFSASPAQGAGFRTATGRVAGNIAVAANATVDIQVGGVMGVATRQVAGVAVNLAAAAPEAAGHLRAWPVGETEPGTSLANFPAGVTRADLAVVKPGAEGKIRIRNVSNGTVRLFADVQGWFADPVPPVAVRPYSTTSALQTRPQSGQAAGTIEYSYVDNIGRLFHGHQADLDNVNSVQWTPVSGNESFTGRPAMIQGADGRLQINAQHTSADIWSTSQTSLTDPTWTAWTNLGGALVSPPVVAALPDQNPVLFAVGAGGLLWRRTSADPQWRSLGDEDLTGELTAVTVRDGIQLFGITGGGVLKTALYNTAGLLSGWTDLGGSGLSGNPAVMVYPGYQLRVFVRASDGNLLTKRQDTTGAYPTAWTVLSGLDVQGSAAALLNPVSGTAEVVIRGADSHLYSTGETTQGSGVWRVWKQVSTSDSDRSATDPTLLSYLNVNGPSWIVLSRNINNSHRVYIVEQDMSRVTAVTLPTP